MSRVVKKPNSPCTNTNDLGFYNSMDSRLLQYRKFKLDDFEKQVDECYWAYPPEKLTALFDSKKRVCGAIITAGGRNDFALPHKREKRACEGVMSREKVALCGTLLYFLKLQCTQHTQ